VPTIEERVVGIEQVRQLSVDVCHAWRGQFRTFHREGRIRSAALITLEFQQGLGHRCIEAADCDRERVEDDSSRRMPDRLWQRFKVGASDEVNQFAGALLGRQRGRR
jgi:hypothetical protein